MSIIGVLLFNTGNAGEVYDQCIKEKTHLESAAEKIYVMPEEILITNDGIYFLCNQEALPVTIVKTDSKGVYIEIPIMDKIWDTCENGHKIYHQACQGCANWWCVFRCKCHSPWNG